MNWKFGAVLLQVLTVVSLSRNSRCISIKCLNRTEEGRREMFISLEPPGVTYRCEKGTCQNVGIYKDDVKSQRSCENCCNRAISSTEMPVHGKGEITKPHLRNTTSDDVHRQKVNEVDGKTGILIGSIIGVSAVIAVVCYVFHKCRSKPEGEGGDVEMQMLPQGVNPPLQQPPPDSGNGILPLPQQVSEEGA